MAWQQRSQQPSRHDEGGHLPPSPPKTQSMPDRERCGHAPDALERVANEDECRPSINGRHLNASGRPPTQCERRDGARARHRAKQRGHKKERKPQDGEEKKETPSRLTNPHPPPTPSPTKPPTVAASLVGDHIVLDREGHQLAVLIDEQRPLCERDGKFARRSGGGSDSSRAAAAKQPPPAAHA